MDINFFYICNIPSIATNEKLFPKKIEIVSAKPFHAEPGASPNPFQAKMISGRAVIIFPPS